MTHREKVERHVAEMTARGVRSYITAPPLYRLTWALGLKTAPPLFQGFSALALVHGTYFAVVWGSLMWIVFWHGDTHPLLAFAAACVAGLLFGLLIARSFRRKARSLDLPQWDRYPGVS